MRRHVFVPLLAALLAVVPSRSGSAFELIETLWYAGDSDDSGATANDIGSQDTSKVFENFSVPDAAGWHVKQIWSSGISVAGESVFQAEWSIRTDMAPGTELVPGDAGTIVAEDISPVTQAPTGRFNEAANYPEYSFRVAGLDLVLPSGQYWLNVTPIAAHTLITATSGANGVGTPIGDAGTALRGPYYTEIASGFSMGVAGSVVPEPEVGALPAALAALGLLRCVRGRLPLRPARAASGKEDG
jgi:hypothetical protein